MVGIAAGGFPTGLLTAVWKTLYPLIKLPSIDLQLSSKTAEDLTRFLRFKNNREAVLDSAAKVNAEIGQANEALNDLARWLDGVLVEIEALTA